MNEQLPRAPPGQPLAWQRTHASRDRDPPGVWPRTGRPGTMHCHRAPINLDALGPQHSTPPGPEPVLPWPQLGQELLPSSGCQPSPGKGCLPCFHRPQEGVGLPSSQGHFAQAQRRASAPHFPPQEARALRSGCPQPQITARNSGAQGSSRGGEGGTVRALTAHEEDWRPWQGQLLLTNAVAIGEALGLRGLAGHHQQVPQELETEKEGQRPGDRGARTSHGADTSHTQNSDALSPQPQV